MPGRGGAGNFQAAIAAKDRVAADLEAGPPTEESFSDAVSVRKPPQYAYAGRGGAGNYYSPKEMSENGTSKDLEAGEILGDGVNSLGGGRFPRGMGSSWTKSAEAEAPRTYGRGGAGNYALNARENKEPEKQQEEEQKKAQLKLDIEQGVEASLAVPPKARLSRKGT